jgi:hypothetical protein
MPGFFMYASRVKIIMNNRRAQCDPGQNIVDLRAAVRKNLFVPKKYSYRMNANAVCQSFKKCVNPVPRMFPAMRRVTVGDTIMYIDPDSPLSAGEYLKLLKKSALKTDINRIAKKLGLLYRPEDRKDITKTTILSHLVSLKIAEPIVDNIKKKTKSKNNNALGDFGGNFKPPTPSSGNGGLKGNGPDHELPPTSSPPASGNGGLKGNGREHALPPTHNVSPAAPSFFKPGVRPKMSFPGSRNAGGNAPEKPGALSSKEKLLMDVASISKNISS